jgi:rubrerythrin
VTKPKPKRDRTAAARVARNKSAYGRAGLVRLDTWIPPEHAPALRERCQQLRDIHLGRARECTRCGFVGRFIDAGETCPKCKLVQ